MPRTPLPRELGDRFTVASARARGVAPARLRRRDLVTPFHGMRARNAAAVVFDRDRLGRPLGDIEQAHLCRAFDYSVRMTDHEFFSHRTAAVIWGIPLPSWILAAAELDVGVFAPQRLPRSRGVRGHQTVPTLTAIVVDPFTGLAVASPAATWAMLGGMLHNHFDLVAAGDSVVRDWRVSPPLASIEDLGATVEAGRRIGVRNLREALPHVRTRSASRPETWTRLVLIKGGLPEPRLNFDVFDDDGLKLACVDLAYPELRIAIEYEGEHHLLDPAQWSRDIARYDALRAAGWHVISVTKDELFRTPQMLLARVRRVIVERS